MKKKTKYKLKNELVVPFWTAIILCLVGAAVSSWQFEKNFFRALSKLNEEPIATITFKKKTAQRKFMDRVVWDRLRQNSPVYNGDTIHTAEMSEATVWFPDGTVIELDANTMAQVFLHDDGTLAADLESGSLTVDASEQSAGLTVSTQTTAVQIKSGGQLYAANGSDGLNLSVISGNAVLDNGQVIQDGSSFAVDSNGRTRPLLSVNSPAPNAKILYYDEGTYPVRFAWNNAGNGLPLTLTIATDKNYSDIVLQSSVESSNAFTLELAKGTYYWRLVQEASADEQQVCQGKFQLIQALKPTLVAPAKDYQYKYRSKTPAVRFIWSESETATAYNLLVSRSENLSNPVIEQRTTSTSSIVSTLGEGTWYWQVTPYYTVNKVGLANPSETGSFVITKSGSLSAPTPTVPLDGAFVDKTSARGVTFSWKAESEASRYRVVISSYDSLRNPIIQTEASENYITLPFDSTQTLRDGQYYWAVSQIDSEGNESAQSAARSFYALEGKVEQRTVFPPDGYQIWAPLSADMRFTWKTNVSIAHHIQIARDEQFNSIVYDREATGTSYGGITLTEGEWWWRVIARDGSFTSATPAKRLVVVGELAAPVIVEPDTNNRAVIRQNTPYTFRWKEVEGADYYRIKIFDPDDLNTPLIDENFITGTQAELDLDSLSEKTYRWEIQSFVYETATASRRNSLKGDTTFQLRKLRPVTLKSPAQSVQIDGFTAMENPPRLEWSSVETLKDTSVRVTKIADDGTRTVRLNERNMNYSQQMQELSAGLYEWTVIAETYDGLDVSAPYAYQFRVMPIPPFEAPRDARTDGGTVFNASYLRSTPYITFRWQQVSRADDYILEIYRKNQRQPMFTTQIRGSENTQFVLEDLTNFARGDYTWTVRAVRLNAAGDDILIDGEKASASFTIDWSLSSSGARARNAGGLYGQ